MTRVRCVAVPGTAILAALATTGCLTAGIIWEAREPSRHHRTITGVTGATVDGDHVTIGLEVHRDKLTKPEHLSVEIPLRKFDWKPENIVQGAPEVPGIVFARPPKRGVRKSSSAPSKGTTLEVEPVDLTRLQDLAAVRDGLAPGIHVLTLQYTAKPGTPAVSIPAFLDTREGHEPYGVVLSDLPDARTHRKFLLLLLPLSVPADVLTLPLQLLVFATGDYC